MKVLFAAGGTGGHINPAIAIAGTLRERHPETEVLFAGTPWGMEASFVPEAGYRFVPIRVRGIERGFSLRAISSNLKTAYYLMTAGRRARKIVRDFQPDMVIGTGGYVSGPVVRAAAKMGIPTLIHEQNAYPGVTTKLLAHDVDVILVAFREAMPRIHTTARMVEVGNPIRQEFLFAEKEESRRLLGLDPNKIVILSCGGSLGAKAINLAIADVLAWHYQKGVIQHIHATGHFGSRWMPQMLRDRGIDIDGDPDIRVEEYIRDMPHYLAACDLIITRAGAITLSEIQAQGKAAILIPSPNVTENHQFHNAMVLANAGASVVIEEKDLTGKLLCEVIEKLTSNREKLLEMGKNAARIAKTDANAEIYGEIMRLYREKRKKGAEALEK